MFLIYYLLFLFFCLFQIVSLFYLSHLQSFQFSSFSFLLFLIWFFSFTLCVIFYWCIHSSIVFHAPVLCSKPSVSVSLSPFLSLSLSLSLCFSFSWIHTHTLSSLYLCLTFFHFPHSLLAPSVWLYFSLSPPRFLVLTITHTFSFCNHFSFPSLSFSLSHT